jgi:hypothetical protein
LYRFPIGQADDPDGGKDTAKMNLEPTDDQQMLLDAFTRFLDEESSTARVRAALPTGFDAELWRGLPKTRAAWPWACSTPSF